MKRQLFTLVLLLGFFSPALLCGQQSFSYEMKLTRVYSNYPTNQDSGGPDLAFQVRTRLVGLGSTQITGSTDVYLPNNRQTGWIDIPDETVATGTYSPTASDPISLCGTGIGVIFDALRAWEEDGNSPGTFNNGVDGDPLMLSSRGNITGAPELSGTMGNVRKFELLFPKIANGYYGFEFSVSYTLTNGINDVIYTGDTQGGPVADACGGGQVYIHPRTGPGFTGGYFQYEQSNDDGTSWSPLGGPTTNPYKSVIVTDDPNQLFQVGLVGANLCIGGDAPKSPANASDLDIFPSVDQSDIDVSATFSCQNSDNGTVTINGVGPIHDTINIRLQLERLSTTGIQIVSAPTVIVGEFPYVFNDVAPGWYRVNVTVIATANSTQVLANCTTYSNQVLVRTRTPPEILWVTPSNPACGEDRGAVKVVSYSVTTVYELLDAGGVVLQSSPTTSTGHYEFTNLAAGTYGVRTKQLGCEGAVVTFVINGTPPAAGGTVEVIQQAAPFDVACQFARTTANFRAAAGTGTNDVVIYTLSFGQPTTVPMRVGEVSEGGVFSVPLFAWDYQVEFTRRDNGCSTSFDFTVTEDPNQISVPDCNFGGCPVTVAPTSCMPNTGQATFSIDGGILPYTINIDGIEATPETATPITGGTEFYYNNLTSGNHFVRVTDNRGCIRDFDLDIPTATNFSIFLSNTKFNLDCNGDTDGRVRINVASFAPGTPPYEYKIPELNDVYGNDNFFENIPPGEYTAIARDMDGCETFRSFTVEEPSPLVVNEVYVVPPICAGDEHQVYVRSSGPILCDDYSDPEGGPIFAPTLRFYFEYSTDGGVNWNEPDRNTSVALDRSNCSVNQRINFPLPSGNYTIQLRRRNVETCLSNSLSITPADFVDPLPLALSLNDAVNPTCAGESDGFITVDFSGGAPGGYELELVRFTSINPPSGATVVEAKDFIQLAGSYTFAGLSPTAANEGYAVRLRNKFSDGTLPDENCAAYFPGDYVLAENFTPITLSEPTVLQGGSVVTGQPLDCTGGGATLIVSGVTGGTPPYQYSVNGSDFTTETTLDANEENDITVRDASGCTIALQHTVTETNIPPMEVTYTTLLPQGCNPTISANLTVTAGEGPYTYAYSQTADGNGEPLNPTVINTTNSPLELDDLSGGTLYLRLTTLDACSKLFSFPVIDPGYQPLTATTTSVLPETCVNDNNGSVTIQAEGGVPPYEIRFSGVTTTETTRTVTGLGTGRYYFGIRDAAGCTILHIVEVTPSSEGFPVTIGGDPATPCTGNPNGSITLTPTGGVAPFILMWGDGAPGATINSIGESATRPDLARAEYELTITDGNGCMVVRSPMPGGRDPIEAEIIDVVQPDCGGPTNGGFTVSILQNSFPESGTFRVSLDGAAPVEQLIFTGLSGGDYVVDVLDDADCGLLQTLMVSLDIPNQIVASSSVSDASCAGEASGSVTLSVTSGDGPFQYAIGTGAFQNDPVFGGLLAGTYDFRIQGMDACVVELNGVMVGDGPTISATLTPTDPTCFGDANGSIEVIPAGGSTPYSYRLNGTGTPQNDPVFTGLSADIDYNVFITDANGCTFTSPTVSLTNPLPVMATPTVTPVSCFGATDGSISILAEGGDSAYEYSFDAGAYAGAMELNGLAAGDYTVQVRDGQGCESGIQTVTVGSPDEIIITITETIPENCNQADGSASATAAGGTGNLTFNWPGNQTGPTATGLSAGNYQLTVTDENNCPQTEEFVIAPASGPSLTLENQTPTRCDASTGSIEVSATGGQAPLVYAWSQDANLDSPLAENLTDGDYTVTVTDANNCTFEITGTVDPSPQPTLTLASSSNSQCTDDNGSATVTPGGGAAPYTYEWSHATGLNVPTLDNLSAGDYTVSLTDANGCTATQGFTLGFTAGPDAIIATEQVATTCGLDNGRLSLTGQGGTAPYTFSWADFPAETGGTLDDLASGDYAVTVSDANGCTFSSSFNVGGSLVPTVSIDSQTDATCGTANGSVTVSVQNLTDPLTYNWSHDADLEGLTATGLAAGDYTVAITDVNGCTADVSITIGSAGGPSLTLANQTPTRCDASTGSIEVSATGGLAPLVYTWSQDANLDSPLAENLAAGDYTVTVTDANNCTAELTVTVEPSPQPTLTLASSSDSQCTDDNGSATVTPSGGTAPYTYEWSHATGLNVPTLNNLSAGDYTITLTDANGCTATQSFTLGFIAGPDAINATEQVATTCGLDNGRLSLTGQGGTAPYTFSWADFPAEIGGTLDNLASGDYAVTVSDANGCTFSSTFNVGGSLVPTVSIDSQTDATCGTANGSVTVSVQNLTDPLTYNWSHDADLEGLTATGLAAGDYTVAITDVNGCTADVSITIGSANGPSLALENQTPTRCDASTGSIEVSPTGGQAPLVYTWSQDANLDSPLAENLAAGDYTVTVTDANNCTAELTITVEPSPQPTLTLASSSDSQCTDDNGSATVTPAAGTAPYSYEWSHAAGLNVPTLDNLSAGDYTVTLTDANGCTATQDFTLGFIAGPDAINATEQVATTCGLDNGRLSLTGQGGTAPYTFSWADFPAETGGTLDNLASGDYAVTVSDANGCTFSSSFNVGGSLVPTVSIDSQTDATCGTTNGTVTVSVQNLTDPLTYNWSHDADLEGLVATGLAAGDYTVTITDVNGCTTDVSITIGAANGPSLALVNQTPTRCDASTGSVEVSPTDGQAPLVYAWSHDANLDSPLAENLAAGDYTVTVTDANNCTADLTVTVEPSPQPTLALASSSNSQCTDDNGSATVTPGGGTAPYTYEWSHAAGLNVTTLNNLSAGDYTVTLTDANGCTATQDFTLGFTAGPDAINATEQVPTTCGLDNGRLSLDGQGGTAPYTFSWADFPAETGGTLDNLASGDYAVTVTDANGCTFSSSFNVGGSLVPTVSIDSQTDATCGGTNGSVTVSVQNLTAPLTYSWSHDAGLEGLTATGLAAGDYTLTITDVNNCAADIGFTIGSAIEPTLSLVNQTPTRCDANTGSVEVSPAGGQAPLVYTWSHDANLNAPLAENLAAGDYTVTVTDANNCTFELTGTVEPSPQPTLALASSSDSQCTDDNGSATVTPGGGAAPYTYEWSHAAGLNVTTLNNLSAGDYTVTLTDANGCTATQDFTLGFIAGPAAINATEQVPTTCGLDNGRLSLSGQGGTAPYTFSWEDFPAETGGMLDNLASGDYTVTVSDVNGCTFSASFNVGGSLVPTVSIDNQTEATCGETNGSVTVSVQNFTAPLTYSWSHDDDLEGLTAIDLAAGDYTLTITDANSCTADIDIRIVSANGPTLTLVSQTPTRCDASTGEVKVVPVGGQAPFTYAWRHDANLNSPVADNLSAGDYPVKVTDANNCTFELTGTVEPSPQPTLTLASSSDSQCTDDNGSATVTPGGGTAPYTYDWSHAPGLNVPTLDNLSAGDYTVTLTDASGCTATQDITLGFIAGPDAINATEQVPTTCGLDNGRLSLSGQGGTAPYTFSWADFPAETGGTRDNLASGDYVVTLTDAIGCTFSASFNVGESLVPVVSVDSQTDATCGDANGSVTVSSQNLTAPLTYIWSHDDILDSPTANGLPSGNYILTVFDANDCTTDISITIGSSVGPTLSLVNQTPTRCDANTGSAEVSSADGQAPLVYTWSQDANLNSPLAENLAAGDYTVTVTDANNCTADISITIGSVAGPTLSLVNQMPTRCDASTGVVEVSSSGGQGPYTYAWSQDANLNAPLAEDLAAGDYTVTVTDANNCTSELTGTVEPSPQPTLALTSSSDSQCTDDNGSATLAPGAGTAPYTYEWSHATGLNVPTLNNLSAGDYTVTLTDANGCTATQDFTLGFIAGPDAINATEQVATTCGLENGRLSLSGQGGTLPYTFTWADFPTETSGTLDDLASGDYVVTVTDANGCTFSATFNVGESLVPVVNVDSQTDATCGDANASVTVSSQNLTSPLTYSWSHDENLNDPTANGLASGIYTVTITDVNGCTADLSISIGSANGPVLTLENLEATRCDANTGVVEVSTTGGQTPYSYVWSHDDNLNAPLAENLAAGDYSVTVSDADGCSAPQSFTISFIAGPDAIIATEQVTTTCGLDNGRLSLSGQGGTPPYTFTWADFPAETGGSRDNLAAGDYAVTVSDSNGCAISSSFNVGGSLVPTVSIDNQTDAACGDTNGRVTVSSQNLTSPLTYSWSHDNNLNGPTANGLASGIYTITITDVNGCTADLSISISSANGPVLTLENLEATRCDANTGVVEVSTNGGQAPYSYVWSHDNNLNAPLAENLAAGDYSVTVSDADGCMAPQSFTISFIAGPDAIIATEQVSTTCGLDNGRLSLSGQGGTLPYTFTWADFPAETGGSRDNLAAGDYAVTISDTNGCTFSSSFNVGTSIAPTVSLIEQTDASCGLSTGRIEVDVQNFTGLVAYVWSHDENLNGPLATNLASGEYVVLVRDELGCQASLTIILDDASGPALELVSTNPSLCEDGNGRIEVRRLGDGQAPFTYSWSHDVNLNSPIAENLAAGDYTVTLTDANGCISSLSATVTLEASPAINEPIIAPADCAQNNGSAIFTVTGGTPPFLYSWSHDPNLNDLSADNLPFGETTFMVTDANGCSDSRSITIENVSGPSGITTLELVQTSCDLNNGRISVTSSGGTEPLTYHWSHDVDLNSSIADNLFPGTYGLTITDADGCSASESYLIDPSQTPTIIADSVLQTNCGEAIGYIEVSVENGNGNILYQWSHDPTLNGPVAANLPSDSYTLIITDDSGCTDERSFIISNQNNTAQIVATATPSVCTDDNGTVTVSITNGQPPYVYDWNHDPQLEGPIAGNLMMGEYVVSITDAGGCTSVTSASVEFQGPPSVESEVTPLDCEGTGLGAISLNVTGGMPPFSYVWDTGDMTASLEDLPAGDYSVTVTDANGCTDDLVATISTLNLPSLELLETTAADCLPTGGSATLVTSLATDEFTIVWPGPDSALMLTTLMGDSTLIEISPLAAGDYPVTIMQPNGCSATVIVSISSTIDWSVDIASVTPPTCFDLADGTATVIVTGPGNFTYQWDDATGGQSTPTATNLTAGIYNVTISDGDGCSRELEAEIVAPDTLQLQIEAFTNPVCPEESTGSITVLGTGGTGTLSYAWDPSELPPMASIMNVPAGDYTVTVTDANGCTETISTTLIDPTAEIIDTPLDTTICLDELYVLDLSEYTNPLVTGPGNFSSTSAVSILDVEGSYQITAVGENGCQLEADLQLNISGTAFVASMVLPSDVVVGDSVAVLENSWPSPQTVTWVFNRTGAREVRQENDQYWFIFDEPGDYELSLLAGLGGCDDLVTKRITVHPDSTTIPGPVLGRPQILSVNVSPNPNDGRFVVDVSLTESAAIFLDLYDANGQSVNSQQGEGQSSYAFTYDLTAPQAGAYFLVVQTVFGRRSTVIMVE